MRFGGLIAGYILMISCSRAAIVPKECHNIGAKSGTTSLFLLQTDKMASFRTLMFNIKSTTQHLMLRLQHNWRALWKNRICSKTMKPRKSLVKPVTWQNISSCLVLPPEIVMQDASNVILWTSADICVVHDDLGWKNRTTRYNCRFYAKSLDLRVTFSSTTTEHKL